MGHSTSALLHAPSNPDPPRHPPIPAVRPDRWPAHLHARPIEDPPALWQRFSPCRRPNHPTRTIGRAQTRLARSAARVAIRGLRDADRRRGWGRRETGSPRGQAGGLPTEGRRTATGVHAGGGSLRPVPSVAACRLYLPVARLGRREAVAGRSGCLRAPRTTTRAEPCRQRCRSRAARLELKAPGAGRIRGDGLGVGSVEPE